MAALLVLIAILNLCPAHSEEAAQEPSCEWNVLIYMCGSDLETKYKAATENLREIASATANDGVNTLIETGGAQKWHTQDNPGIEVANDRLQHWTYGKDGFTLVDKVEDSCMAYARTLSGFYPVGGGELSGQKEYAARGPRRRKLHVHTEMI